MIWAHFDRNRNEGQTLEEHLKHVEEEMGKGLETVSFPESVLNIHTIQETGRFHDIGKISTWFQRYLLTGKAVPEKSHSLISAALYASYAQSNHNMFPLLAVIAITCHHGNLDADMPGENVFDYLEKQYENCVQQGKERVWERYLVSGGFSEKNFRKQWRQSLKKVRKEKRPQYFFALQFLFSKLISVDKRDSAGLLEYGNLQVRGDADTYLAQKTKGIRAAVRDDRQKIRDAVLQRIRMLSEEQLEEERIFTLTAPTGTGKTLTSISAAILLSDRLEQKNGIRPHIVTAVPFLNILEQTTEDYKGIFGEILVHSSVTSPVDFKKEERAEMPLQEKMLLAASWHSPVVLTTFVQLFESILSGENNRLLKVNRLANAIVILDEIQALEAEKYPLYAVVLDMVAKCYGTRFILMTATQPKLFDCASVYGYIPRKTTELLREYKNYFMKLKRTKLVSLMEFVTDFDSLCDYIEDCGLSQNNILIVVNKIADSIELYQKLQSLGYAVMYLSTNLTGRDRKRVIQEAKIRLKDKESEPFIMVSTQTIEAGVDLDFDIAFRDLAPLESIIQTAGRVNRSGDKGDLCPVYLFDTGSAAQIYSIMAIRETKSLLNQEEIPESGYQELVEQYYDAILNHEAVSFDRSVYQKGILELNYEEISKFKMIQEGDRYSVIFLQDEEAELLVHQLCQLICMKEHSFEKKAQIQQTLNQIGSYMVDIFAEKIRKNRPISFAEYSKEICNRRIELNYFIVPRDDLERYYNETGFIAEERGAFMF